jgi:hypothetical protein
MALRLQFLTLVIPRDRLRQCEELPFFLEAMEPQGGIFFETSWYDAHLWCDTAMSGPDIDDQIEAWESRGLRVKDELGRWADLCLCASQRGPLGQCPWLSFDAAQNAVWLSGADPGPLVGGMDQVESTSADLIRWEQAGEASYAVMYESRRPKDDYEDACLALARAADAARFLHRADDLKRLEARLSHIRSVYDHQMRGF